MAARPLRAPRAAPLMAPLGLLALLAPLAPRAPRAQAAEAAQVDPASVPSLPLLGDGAGVPMVGVGLCCRASARGDAARQAVLDFLLLGGRHLDTAQLYGNHAEVGLGLRQALERGVRRKDVFLTTKIMPVAFGFEATAAWLEAALRDLGTQYVDLVLLHWATVEPGLPCKRPRACRQETWLALQRARERGQIRHLGVSNFGPRQMEELTALGGAPVAVNQLEYHPWAPAKHHETVRWCHERGIAVTAYGSMGGNNHKTELLTMDALRQIGATHGKTAGQVLLRWAVQKNVSVIPGTSNPFHMSDNLRLFDFELVPEAMALLDAVPEPERRNIYGHVPDDAE